MQQQASLTIVGSGIKFLSHLTTETKSHIQQSDVVLYLVNDPAMKEWIKQNSRRSESLDHLYSQYPLRIDCYRAITKYIIETVNQNGHVCVVLYGHPSLFSQPGLKAAQLAQQAGIPTQILPGISAEDCLLADLFIDTSTCGCQSFEATDFLLNRRRFDPMSHLLLWQIDVIGALDHAQHHDNQKGIRLLAKTLMQSYSENHDVIIYEAAQYPSFQPLVIKTSVSQLHTATLSPISTLYIPPLSQQPYDKNLAIELGISIADLEKKNDGGYE